MQVIFPAVQAPQPTIRSALKGTSHLSLDRAIERYRAGTSWRDRMVHDLILEDAASIGSELTFLDIGCGKGFDTSIPLQRSLAKSAGKYIGIEPDTSISVGDYITDIYRCAFERADLSPETIHVAFAIMVLEHLSNPGEFWNHLWDVLMPGGVFWALTIDARHWFTYGSLWSERLGIKELYLSWLHGKRGEQRYENYPVYYRCNTPDRVALYAKRFSSVDVFNCSRIDQTDGVLPSFLQPISRTLESWSMRCGLPGTLLLIRAVK
jgi:SAM-dependent methyltransferase